MTDDQQRPLCPQDPQHYLDSHAPGGAWYGVGHDGQPSPFPGMANLPALPDDLTYLAVYVPVPQSAREAHGEEMEKVARNAVARALADYLEVADR